MLESYFLVSFNCHALVSKWLQLVVIWLPVGCQLVIFTLGIYQMLRVLLFSEGNSKIFWNSPNLVVSIPWPLSTNISSSRVICGSKLFIWPSFTKHSRTSASQHNPMPICAEINNDKHTFIVHFSHSAMLTSIMLASGPSMHPLIQEASLNSVCSLWGLAVNLISTRGAAVSVHCCHLVLSVNKLN